MPNTPAPTPAPEPTPEPARIVAGIVVVHCLSHKFYKVDVNDGEAVEYTRFVDGEHFALTLPVFVSKFRPASEQEKLMRQQELSLLVLWYQHRLYQTLQLDTHHYQ